jgi:hypothetical protein
VSALPLAIVELGDRGSNNRQLHGVEWAQTLRILESSRTGRIVLVSLACANLSSSFISLVST